MPKTSTTTSVWRSGGGDDTKTTYAGSMLMVADFYIPSIIAANTTAVQRSASDTRSVLLPVGAVVVEIQVSTTASGGSSPTIDMGWIGHADPTAVDVDGLIAEGVATTGKLSYTWATATAGDDMGAVMSSTQIVKITGGVGASSAVSGTATGRILYYVPTDGAYTS